MGSPYHARLFGMQAALVTEAGGRDRMTLSDVEQGLASALEDWAEMSGATHALFRRVLWEAGASRRMIALAGVAAEFGVVMLIYLKHSWEERLAAGRTPTLELLDEAIREGAVQRVRPKAMTVSVIIAGLLPIMWSHGTGSEVMQRIAAPMIGGMITAPLLSLFVIPAAYRVMRRRELIAAGPAPSAAAAH